MNVFLTDALVSLIKAPKDEETMHIYDSRGAAALIHKIDLQRISFLTIERVFAHQQTTVIRVILTNSDFLHVQTTRLLQAP